MGRVLSLPLLDEGVHCINQKIGQDAGCLLQEMVKLCESQCGTLDEVCNSVVAVHRFWSSQLRRRRQQRRRRQLESHEAGRKVENQITCRTNYGAVNSVEPQGQSLTRSIPKTKQSKDLSCQSESHQRVKDPPKRALKKIYIVKGPAAFKSGNVAVDQSDDGRARAAN